MCAGLRLARLPPRTVKAAGSTVTTAKSLAVGRAHTGSRERVAPRALLAAVRGISAIPHYIRLGRQGEGGGSMRATYDGGKSTPYRAEITANPDKRRRTAEIETTIYIHIYLYIGTTASGRAARRAQGRLTAGAKPTACSPKCPPCSRGRESTRRPQSRTRRTSSSRGSAWP